MMFMYIGLYRYEKNSLVVTTQVPRRSGTTHR